MITWPRDKDVTYCRSSDRSVYISFTLSRYYHYQHWAHIKCQARLNIHREVNNLVPPELRPPWRSKEPRTPAWDFSAASFTMSSCRPLPSSQTKVSHLSRNFASKFASVVATPVQIRVPMSRFEQDRFIDYTKVDQNIREVRRKSVSQSLVLLPRFKSLTSRCSQAQSAAHLLWKGAPRPPWQCGGGGYPQRRLVPQAPSHANCLSGCDRTNGTHPIHVVESWQGCCADNSTLRPSSHRQRR